jgi:predicted signal transduction protein with EAL and GGDEF domain
VNKTADAQLIDEMPDLLLVVGRDGTLLSHGGGRAVAPLVPPADAVGRPLGSMWPEAISNSVQHFIRKAIASRRPLDGELTNAGRSYHLRVTPQGPDRVLCALRAGDCASQDVLTATGIHLRPYADRRGFMKLFQETIAVNLLTERPAAVIVIHLDGVDDIARMDARLAEQVVTAALLRLSREMPPHEREACVCVGQLSENQMAFVVETTDRRAIETLVACLQAGLGAPLTMDAGTFTLSCFAGVAVLGRDATSSKGLLDSARMAANESRQNASRRARFFSDTMKLKSLARIDVARELRDAITAGAVQARYVGRHDLANGRLVSLVAYARWTHALRGDIPPREFLAVADATGAGVSLSRAILAAIGRDFADVSSRVERNVTLSYGPLRQHLLHDDFLNDIKRFLAARGIPVERFEIRIAESTFIALPSLICDGLQARGVRLVVDEVGRGAGSLDRTARAPLWGMQMDGARIDGLRTSAVAERIRHAGIAMANALGVVPIATGVDDDAQRVTLLALGCRLGSGDLYPDPRHATAQRRSSDRARP